MSRKLHPSTYDDAVSVNMSAHGDGIRRALASVGVITQRAPAPLAATTTMIIVLLPTPLFPTTTAADKTTTAAAVCSRCYSTLLERRHPSIDSQTDDQKPSLTATKNPRIRIRTESEKSADSVADSESVTTLSKTANNSTRIVLSICSAYVMKTPCNTIFFLVCDTAVGCCLS